MFRRFMALVAVTLLVTACAEEPRKPPPQAGVPAPPDVTAAPSDAQRTGSGISFKVLTVGTGTRHPRPNSRVTVHYTGWTTDGKSFDSSIGKTPLTIGLDEVIPGWTEGVQMMVEGDKRRFWIPEGLAYRGGDPKGMLVFDIELIKIDS